MKKVLVIGATGMMGSHLVPLLLEKGYAVDGVTLDDTASENPALRYIRTDAYDDNVLRELLNNGYDGIIDFLHYANPNQFKERSSLFLNATKHYIFLSSYRVYADCAGVLTENSPRLTEAYSDNEDLMNNDTYGVSKCRCEDVLNQSGFKNYTIVRPVIVYAENCLLLVTWKGRVIPYRARQKGKLLLPIEAKDKHAAIIYAGDIARLFAELLFNEKAFGETYTLGSPETITWGEMAKMYEELCGITSEWIPGEDFGKMATGNTQEIPAGMKFMLYYDRFFNRDVNVEKVFQDTKVKAEQFISHKEGLKKCLAAYPENYQPSEWEKAQNDYMSEYIKNHNL